MKINIQIMKKIVLTLLFAAIAAVTYSQEGQEGWYLGVQASPVLSWMTSSNQNTTTGNGSNLGIKLGILGEYHFGERYAITAGAGAVLNHGGTLSHMGMDSTVNVFSEVPVNVNESGIPTTPVDIKYNMQMFEASFGLRMKTDPILLDDLYFYGEAPFLIHIRTQARGTWDGMGRENITGNTRFFNLAWGIGGGAQYDLGSKAIITAGLFIHQGISHTVRVDEDNIKLGINALTLKLGVLFKP